MTDDQGVLGNLPRSRPGQRSAKRASRAEAARSGAERSGAEPAAASRGSKAATPAAGESQPAPTGGADPVRGAIRGVAGLAATGAKLATGVTREVIRRFPRP